MYGHSHCVDIHDDMAVIIRYEVCYEWGNDKFEYDRVSLVSVGERRTARGGSWF